MSSGLELKDTSAPPDLEGLDSEERIEAMAKWFYENFEDPAQNTPYETAEGGYQYIWGGPYDALDQIADAFPDAAQEEIEQAVDEVQSDGIFDWAPHFVRIQPDDDDTGVEPESTLEERVAVLSKQLEELERHIIYLRREVPSMGHNQPPEHMRLGLDQGELDEALESVAEIRAELAKPDPVNNAELKPIEKAENRFRLLAGKVLNWMKAAGKALVLGAVGKIGADLWSDPSIFFQELDTIADTLNAWGHHLQSLF